MGARQNDIPMADFWAVTGTFRMRRDSSGWAGMAGVRENKCRYMIQRFLSVADADRALRGFRTCPHDIRDWARRCATEIHQLRHGRPHSIRALNDLDFIGKKAMRAEPSKTVLINVLTATRRPFAR